MSALRVAAALLAVLAVGCLGAPDARAGRKCGGLLIGPTIVGTSGPDTLTGTKGFDVIRAGRGDDRIDGRGGADYICGGPGDDLLDGADGVDTLKGGSEDDIILGGDGGDSILGQGGTDSADGGEDLDSCEAEELAGCESDIALTPAFFQSGATAGDPRVYSSLLTVRVGGSTARNVYAIIALPAEAEFVPGSASACTEGPLDRLTCSLGTIEAHGVASINYSFRFPDCAPPGGQTLQFGLYAADERNADPFPENNAATQSALVKPAPNCPQ